MKHLILFTILSFGRILTYGQGFIGDVKYSIITPDAFTKRYPDWVLMDGGASQHSKDVFSSSKLHLDPQYELEALPDGRGVFLRGMNEGRSKAEGDAGGDRAVGSPQEDSFKKHNHNMRHWQGNGGQGGGELSTANHLTDMAENTQQGGDETRPRNIALYVYIKVN